MRAFSPFHSQSSHSQSSQSQHSLLPLHNPPATPRSSILLSPPAPLTSPSAASADTDVLLALRRQTTHLQSTIQTLLDAQSAGLLAGLGGDNSTPTSTSSPPPSQQTRNRAPYRDLESPPAIHGRSSSRRTTASKKRISLRSARQGISSALRTLSTIKVQESSILAHHLALHTQSIAEIDASEQKRQGIQTAIAALEADPQYGPVTLRGLEEEEQRLEAEIRAVEERLFELRGRLKALKKDRDERSNILDARLSSWRAALSDLEKDIGQTWLDAPPPSIAASMSLASQTNPARTEGGVYTLPRTRRTLPLVKESLTNSQTLIKQRKVAAETERDACLSGAQIWTFTIRTVAHIEAALKKEVALLSSRATSPSATDRSSTRTSSRVSSAGSENQSPFSARSATGAQDAGGENIQAAGGMQAVLEQMDRAIGTLSQQLEQAEAREWKLLVCCVGAEVAALTEGRDMLEGALGEMEMSATVRGRGSVVLARGGGEGGPLGGEAEMGRGNEYRTVEGQRGESEDDEPGPELLISHLED